MSSGQQALESAPWISAWAPGWGSGRLPDGTGVSLPKGSLVVMQVHYNLVNGSAPDRSRAVFTLAPPAGLKAMETVLLPAPVELACVKGEKGRLCNRDAALADLGRKYGSLAAVAPGALLFFCGKNAANPKATTTSTCDRTLSRPTTIHLVAGHMHLLGKSIRVELNPGTAGSKVLLDIPRWDFHWQNAYALQQPRRGEGGRHPPRDVPLRPHAAPPRRPRDPEDAPLRALGRGDGRRDVPRHRPGRSRLTCRVSRAVAKEAELFVQEFPAGVVPVDAGIARRAAEIRASRGGVTLGDALVLASGDALDAEVLTADSSWSKISRRVSVI